MRLRNSVGESVTVLISTRMFSCFRKPLLSATIIAVSRLNSPSLMTSSAMTLTGSSASATATAPFVNFIYGPLRPPIFHFIRLIVKSKWTRRAQLGDFRMEFDGYAPALCRCVNPLGDRSLWFPPLRKLDDRLVLAMMLVVAGLQNGNQSFAQSLTGFVEFAANRLGGSKRFVQYFFVVLFFHVGENSCPCNNELRATPFCGRKNRFDHRHENPAGDPGGEDEQVRNPIAHLRSPLN